MCKLGRHVFLAAVLLHSVAFADSTTEPTALPFAVHPSISSLPSVSTCRSKEVNYITHTLPQQCLKSRPTTPPVAIAANATVPPDAGPSVPVSAGSDAASVAGNDVAQTPGAGAQSPTISGQSVEASATGPQSAAGSAQPSPAGADVQGENSPNRPAEPEAEAEAEADSPLDNANFLSFEEWKKQNLAKAGQSPENVGQGRGTAAAQGRKPRPVNINNELDFLGEDTEIELDFGFGNQADRAASISAAGEGAKATGDEEAAQELSHRPRSKDAGKTCKERFNYASFDCAATVLKTNQQCKSSSSLLVENKDSYMLNECAADNKFVIVELCDDILVDTVVLANFEFFSSMFRTFRVSVSDRYPVKLERWKELGTFEARNSRDIQAFLVENPLIWARYLRIEFLTHYGNEYYCPVSLLRVHGTTMMEEFRHQEEAARGEEDLDEVIESESQALPAIPPNAQDPAPVEVPPAEPPKEAELVAPSDSGSGGNGDPAQAESPNQSAGASSTADDRATSKDSTTATSAAVPEGSTSQTNSQPVSIVTPPERPDASNLPSSNVTQASHNQTDVEQPKHASTSTDGSQTDTGHLGSSSQNATNASPIASSDADQNSAPPSREASNVASNGTSTKSVQSGEGAKGSVTQPQTATPTTQESFFKSIHKRLQMLESNSTLSLQYIEDQSRILRDAFTKVEKRQLGKTEKFLDQLNSTVMAELREFRQQYDQLWQSTVIELENRREQHQREMLAISTRLTLLADELVFQKRMAVVQSTLILLCLGLVLFVRSGSSYLELPLVQQMMQKSQTALRLQFDSPSSSPPPRGYRRHGHSSSTEERKRFRFFGASSGNMSDASTDGARSPALEFSPPTPTSDVDGEVLSREQSPEPVRKTHSSPSTPRGFRDGSKLSWEAKALGVGDGQTLMRRRSPLRSGESVGDFYEDSQTERSRQKGSGKAGSADPNQPGDSGGSASDSDDCLGYM
ncbi:UNC-like C-terminal-domain-containing protein [Macrophomina phaseolina]|uniref:UNC-like C-terminal-domain-containing protein n=1 Tax=Macrophomina phaseolina TaxID=35725 RepID=A0ABQ8GNY5_9PEZI|nr:UNC-like C-terminal-domain-containing protein [Macrophomina phaseolina]